MIDLGSYVSGDTGTDTVITIEDEDGVAIDLGGATAITLVAASSSRDTFELTGSIQDAEAGEILFEDLAQAYTPTTSRPKTSFEGLIRWVQSGETFYSRDKIKFSIELFP